MRFSSNKKRKQIGKIYIIAEIGTAHSGKIDKAEQLIAAAKKSGADCAKFQIVFADEIVHREVGKINLPGGKIDIYDSFKKVEQESEFYQKLVEICNQHEIDILFSVFGTKSLELARQSGATKIKIASPELNYYSLLEKASESPIILSTGVSTDKDIAKAIIFLNSLNRSPDCIMQCVTSYPAAEHEFNLRVLKRLSHKFNVATGISDHSTHPWLIPALSVALGATVIEKHLTLSNDTDGLDDKIALTPQKFSQLVEKIRSLDSKTPPEAIRQLRREFGRTRINRILGSSRKRLTPSEKKIYPTTNRSLVATREIPRGATITTASGSFLRAETNHSPGITEDQLHRMLGRKATQTIPAGEGINWKNTKKA
ncbi:MAG: N-acetylneuraminate synthase family protein [Spirochaetales bacterium]|nr:N-acetylneuraminate synthase family protein [Spirochaetales bacterium]